MSALAILELLKKLLPKTKIGAWILGLIAAAMALALGVSQGDLKEKFCASEPVVLPSMPATNVATPVVGPGGALPEH